MPTKNIPIFYFSGTGNTWWVSMRMIEKLREMGHNVHAYSIEQLPGDKAAQLALNADVIGLGFPIYGSDAPRNFHQFLDQLPALQPPKLVFGFITQLAWSGDGCNFLEKKLGKKGYVLTWAAEFKMPNNIALGFSPLRYTDDYAQFVPLLTRNKKRIASFCEKIDRSVPSRQHGSIFDTALGWVQRAPFRWAHDCFREYWSVDAGKCTSCGICARYCPTGNIIMVDELPQYADKCIYCMRCFNYCPTLAVHYMNLRNTRAERIPPFQGPVPEFHPRLIASEESNNQ
jgi:ferredoxin/flavodoxin